MNIGMKDEINKSIELWLEDLGYIFNRKLYGQVVRLSNSSPSYKVMADITLKNVKKYNLTIDPGKAWNYTTRFVNGMKSNMIVNNNYFQTVLKNGLYNPLNNKQDKGMSLFDQIESANNDYNYLKNIWINCTDDKRIFDFIILINGFPLLLVETVDDKKFDSFERAFERLEEAFDKFPMFFNFNKLILITDGDRYKLGTLYDFPEDFLEFSGDKNDEVKKSKFSMDMLEEIISTKNVLKYIKDNKDIQQIQDYLMKDAETVSSKNIHEYEYKKEDLTNLVVDTDKKSNIEMENEVEDNNELDFLANIFTADLDAIIDSEEFEKKLTKVKEVPNFKDNKAYIEDIQRNNNLDTLETFAKANEKLVMKEVNRFLGYQTNSMDYDDMYQLGYIGLLKAMERFDLEKDNEFSTYAVYWIRQSINRGINDDSLLIRIPAHRWEPIMKIKELEYESSIFFGRVDYDWISEKLGESKEKVMELIKIRNSFMSNVSLDTLVGSEEDITLGEFIADEEYDVEQVIIDLDLRKRIEEVLNTVDDRSKDIIVRRFGLHGDEPMTLEEIGRLYDVTRERIRQIEKKALRKLRQQSRSKRLKEFLEG